MPKSVYSIEHNQPGSLIGGWHLYREDEGENCKHILAQGLSEREAKACLKALQTIRGKRGV